MIVRALLVWAVLLLCAIANGGFREAVLVPRLGGATAHVVSTLLLSGVVILLATVTIGWIAPRSSADALLVGVMWLILVLAFEFLAGHYLFGNSWEKLLADYNLLQGRVWPLVLIVTCVAPLVAYLSRR
jgi:hypothetical protein